MPNTNYQLCDTIFYQGMSTSQTQALKYIGTRKIRATTGELMWCTGRNNFLPIKVIYRLHIGEEIADVNLQPFSTYIAMLNPINWIGAAITWTSNRLNGFHFSPSRHPTSASVMFHAPILANVSIGQMTDIESHKRKYKHWLQQSDRTSGLILYGVSRGTATTFCAFAKEKYPEVKLVILEGAIDSIPQVLPKRYSTQLKSDFVANNLASGLGNCLSLFTAYKPDGISPLACVADYPENIPTVFVTSEIDTAVPCENTERIAKALASREKNDVYLLKLKKSSHPNYMFDDHDDRNHYETFLHAIYKKYNMKHNPDFAQQGERLMENSILFETEHGNELRSFRI